MIVLQALRNLTGNALRHTPDGGAIALMATSVEAGTVLTVSDTGEGIVAARGIVADLRLVNAPIN